MKGEEAKLLGLLREFQSVKMSCTSCLFFLFFCLRGFKLDKTHNYSGDISETEAITSLMRVCPKLTRYQQEQSQYFS